jgi:hypothetical protein
MIRTEGRASVKWKRVFRRHKREKRVCTEVMLEQREEI